MRKILVGIIFTLFLFTSSTALAATTWKLESLALNKDIATVTVREVVDGVDGKTYSVSLHKSHPLSDFKAALKEKILKDRQKQAVIDTIKASVDFTNFEAYLNQ